jgi:hypothetical protein
MSELLKIGLGGLLSFAGALLAVVVGHWLHPNANGATSCTNYA